MDPLSIATAVTEGLSLSVKAWESVKKVSKNNEKLRKLADSTLSQLYYMQELDNMHQGTVKLSPHRVQAMQKFQDRLYDLNERCRNLLPSESPGRLRRVRTKLVAFVRRNDVEEELQRLSRQVADCKDKFDTFCSVHTLDLVSEAVTKVQQVDTFMALSLCDTPRDHRVVERIVYQVAGTTNAAIDLAREQFSEIFLLLGQFIIQHSFRTEQPDELHAVMLIRQRGYFTKEELLMRILQLTMLLRKNPYELRVQEGARALHELSVDLSQWMIRDSTTLNRIRPFEVEQRIAATWSTNLYRMLSQTDWGFLPSLADSLTSLCRLYLDGLEDHLLDRHYIKQALTTADNACKSWRLVMTRNPSWNSLFGLAEALSIKGKILQGLQQSEDATTAYEKSVELIRALIKSSGEQNSRQKIDSQAIIYGEYYKTLKQLAILLLGAGREQDVLAIIHEFLQALAAVWTDEGEWSAETTIHTVYKTMSDRKTLRLADLEDAINRALDISRKFPRLIKIYLQLFGFLAQASVAETSHIQRKIPISLLGDRFNIAIEWLEGPFNFWEMELDTSMTASSQLSPFVTDYWTSLNVRELLACMFSQLFESRAGQCLNPVLIWILAREYEAEATAVLSSAFEDFRRYSPVNLGLVWKATHTLLHLSDVGNDFLIHHDSAPGFSALLITIGQSLWKEYCVVNLKEPDNTDPSVHVARALRKWSWILWGARQEADSFECLDASVEILRNCNDFDDVLVESLELRSDFHLRVENQEECFRDAWEAYTLQCTEVRQANYLWSSKSCRLMILFSRLMRMSQHLLISAGQLHGNAATNFIGDVSTFAQRSYASGDHTKALRCLEILRALNSNDHYAWMLTDNSTICTILLVSENLCIPDSIPAKMTSCKGGFLRRIPLLGGGSRPIRCLLHSFSRIAPIWTLWFKFRGSLASLGISKWMIAGPEIDDSAIPWLCCELESRARAANPHDAVVFRREVVKIWREVWDRRCFWLDSDLPLVHAKAESLAMGLEALISSLRQAGGSNQEEIADCQTELQELRCWYSDLDDIDRDGNRFNSVIFEQLLSAGKEQEVCKLLKLRRNPLSDLPVVR